MYRSGRSLDGSTPGVRLYGGASGVGMLILGVALAAAWPSAAQAHAGRDKASIEVCETSTHFGQVIAGSLAAPFDTPATLAPLLASPLGMNVLGNLWVNHDKAQPCFAISDTPIWIPVVSRIPADVLGIEVSRKRDHALLYVSGLPDYTLETPPLFTSFKPGNTYSVYKMPAEPQPDTREVTELLTGGAIGIFVNGSAIFNYTDTFSYQDKGAWVYDAGVAEAAIVNSDVAHATPSNLPQFPKSRGIFHNHMMSREVLKQLQDPYARGVREHSRVIGYAIDGYPIYGPLGYATADASSDIRVLRTSYVKRDWVQSDRSGTGKRSSLPGWVVVGPNGDYAGDALINMFGKSKQEMLLADAGATGPVQYKGDDEALAEEIRQISQHRTLARDAQGYVYWEYDVRKPDGSSVPVRNYLLKSSELWGPTVGQVILPATYQVADQEKFQFAAVTGAFAEDYEFIPGYGDLDFHNGIESFVPDRKQAAYHYVTPFSADIDDADRLGTSTFPYFIGIRYRGVVEPLNRSTVSGTDKAKYLTEQRAQYETVLDLGVVGKDENGKVEHASVIETWRATLADPE